MSEAEEYDSVRVSADGVRVLKRFAADQFPVPAIAFEISSGRDEEVTLRLSDRVPQGVAVDDLGFHPDYGSEYWTIEEDRITFERDLEPNDSYTTVYGIREADDVGQFLTDPTIESVVPPLSAADRDEAVVLESDDALVEDAISRGVEPSDEDEEEPAEEPEVPSTLDLGEPDADDPDRSGDNETDADEAVASADPAAEPDEAAEPDPAAEPDGAKPAVEPATEGSVVASLATELRSDSVSQADLDLLREVLVEQHDGSGSTTARLDQLQQEVTELRAYTGAIEAFLDENGTGAELIDSFEARLDDFGDRLEHLETEFVVEVQGRIEDLEEQFEQLESDAVEEFDRLEDLETRTDEVAERADDADARTRDLVGRLEDLESELDELERIDEIEENLERLDEIESELSDIQEWRKQLIKTLGG